MKEIPLPAERAAQQKKARSLKGLAKAYNACLLGLAIAAIACLVGVLVVVIMMETGSPDADRELLLYILTGCFAGGAVVFAAGAVLFGKLAQEATRTHLDFVERCCGDKCFFVGEGTIAEFCEDVLVIRSQEDDKKERIRIPYSQIKFYSVCTRVKPQECGKWSVVIEMPAHYVMKKGTALNALVEADGKERLYRTLEERGLELRGERPPRGEKRKNVRFEAVMKFLLPDPVKRRRSLMFAGLGVVLLAAGILIAIFWRDMILVGAILSVFGVFLAVRSAMGFSRARGVLAFYEEGIFWRESGRAEADRFFLKWEELERVKRETIEGKHYLAAVCPYGSYHIPEVERAYDYLKTFRPAMCEE